MSLAALLDEVECAHGTCLNLIDDLPTDEDGTVLDHTLLNTLSSVSQELASVIDALREAKAQEDAEAAS